MMYYAILLMLTGQTALSQVILTPPNDTIVFINQSAVFSCETDGGFIDWRINGTFYQDIQRAVRNDIYISSVDITNSQLTIFARVKYNPTEIQCVTGTVGGGIADESPIVILVIENTSADIMPTIPYDVTSTSEEMTSTTKPEVLETNTKTPDIEDTERDTSTADLIPIVCSVVGLVIVIVIIIIIIVLVRIHFKKQKYQVSLEDGVVRPSEKAPSDMTGSEHTQNEDGDEGGDNDDHFASTAVMTSNVSGDDSRLVGKPYRQQPGPRPRINDNRGSNKVMGSCSADKHLEPTVKTLQGATSNEENSVCDADEVIDVVKDIVMEESDNEVHSDCSESFSVSEEESDDDENGSIVLFNGRTHNVMMIPKSGDSCYPNPPLILSHQEHYDSEVRMVNDQVNETVLVTQSKPMKSMEESESSTNGLVTHCGVQKTIYSSAKVYQKPEKDVTFTKETMKADGMVTLETLNDTQSATPENVFLDPPATDGPLQHVEHRRRKRRRVNKPKLHITSGGCTVMKSSIKKKKSTNASDSQMLKNGASNLPLVKKKYFCYSTGIPLVKKKIASQGSIPDAID